MQKEVEENLAHFDIKLNRGYDRSVVMTSEKAQRASIYTDKVLHVYPNISDFQGKARI